VCCKVKLTNSLVKNKILRTVKLKQKHAEPAKETSTHDNTFLQMHRNIHLKVSFYGVMLIGKRKDETLYHLILEPDIKTTMTDTRTRTDFSMLSAFGADIKASLITWHKRLGHLGYLTLLKMLRRDLSVGLNIDGDCAIPASLFSGQIHKNLAQNRSTQSW
jgi:hypothetical protein